MKAKSLLLFALVSILTAGVAAGGDLGAELNSCFDSARDAVESQLDDFAAATCKPACPGQICCANGTCVNSVLACGDTFGALPPTFETDLASDAKIAGFATQGVLAAAQGRKANVWTGYISGDAWRAHGVPAGYYNLVVPKGASTNAANVEVVDRDGRTVARLPATLSLVDPGDSTSGCDWGTDAGCLYILCCYNGTCMQLILCLTFG